MCVLSQDYEQLSLTKPLRTLLPSAADTNTFWGRWKVLHHTQQSKLNVKGNGRLQTQDKWCINLGIKLNTSLGSEEVL